MSTSRRTMLLIILIVALAGTTAVAYACLGKMRFDAEHAHDDLKTCQAMLADLSGTVSAPPARAGELDAAELNRRLHDAAMAARIPDPASIEPGTANRLPDSEYQELPVFLRLDALTLQQLVTFLHHLSAVDPSARAKTIELATPESSSAATTQNGNAPELWSADVTVAYHIYAPQGAGTSERTRGGE